MTEINMEAEAKGGTLMLGIPEFVPICIWYNGKSASVKVVDGELVFVGNLPTSEAARVFLESLAFEAKKFFELKEEVQLLRQQLSAASVEIERLQHDNDIAFGSERYAKKQLASAQATNQRLRGIILKLIDRWWPFVHGSVMPSETAKNMLTEASDAIQPQQDTTALREYGKRVADAAEKLTVERCAEVAQFHKRYHYRMGSTIKRSILALPLGGIDVSKIGEE